MQDIHYGADPLRWRRARSQFKEQGMSRRFHLAWLVSVVVTVAIATAIVMVQVEQPTETLMRKADDLSVRAHMAGKQADRSELEECESLYREALGREDLDDEQRANVEINLLTIIALQDPARIDAQLETLILPMLKKHGLGQFMNLFRTLKELEAFDVCDNVLAVCERELGAEAQADIKWLRIKYGRPQARSRK